MSSSVLQAYSETLFPQIFSQTTHIINMFLLVLVTILVGVRGQGPAATGSYGFGASGGLGYGGNYGNGYGSRYNYIPQSQISNGYGGFSNAYMPGRQYPFTPFYQNSVSSLDYPNTQSLSTSSFRIPVASQNYDSKQCQRYINSDYPSFITPTQSSVVNPTPYYSVPYFETVETYKFYNPTRAYIKNKKEGGLNVGSKVETVANNESRNGSLESSSSDEPLKEEPVLQLTYLGYVPYSPKRSASGDNDNVAGQRIPFYILDYDESPASPRTSSASPTMYVSPTRLVPAASVYTSGSVTHSESVSTDTGVYPSGSVAHSGSIGTGTLLAGASVSHGISSQGYSHIPIRTGPVLSPYTPSYRDVASDDHPGYHLIDVNPVPRVNSRLYSEPLLGLPRPTFMPLIQTLTGPMGGPISGVRGPPSRGLNTDTQPQSQANGRGQQGFNNGFGSFSFGSPGLSG